jgi:hypothetical protein
MYGLIVHGKITEYTKKNRTLFHESIMQIYWFFGRKQSILERMSDKLVRTHMHAR